ncbi:hypothetical protein [Sphingomonas sp.]|uniref:hypothetical protein n=1 Tax=Sphingomonas sp. TaxID=28214 RepID=UPI001B2B1E6F|nr:hypothetical protein [Sphingomonas sp.]MBO9711355.1 hypothetical protein [Sphingomonas sp.]
MTPAKLALPLLGLALLAGCKQTGDIAVDGGVGITSVRSACPRVAVPMGTGDVTLFDPADSREAQAIDVEATLTNVAASCADGQGAQVLTTVNFAVLANRRDAGPARDVTLPYFVTLVRGGSSVVAKSVGHVTIHFDAGQTRASATGTGSAQVARSAATLPEDVRRRLTRKRKAGNEDAAMDPLSDPSIRDAVRSATFEALVGFQLTDDQLKYNVTR